MRRLEALQALGRGDVGTRARGGQNFARQQIDAVQTEVEAMRGHRVHAHGGVADQGETRRDEALGINPDQRIGVTAARAFHFAQTTLIAPGDVALEVGVGQLQQGLHLMLRQGEHHGREVFGQGQQGQGLADAEPLPRGVVMRLLMLHAAHQHGLAEVVRVGPDAHLAAGFGEPAVGGDQQLRPDSLGRGSGRRCLRRFEVELNALRIGAHRAQAGLVVQGVFALALHRSPKRAADLLIGHEGAELGFAAQRRYAHGMRIVAVEHHGVFERKHLIGRDVVEHPGLAQGAQGAQAERNFAAVERGVGQRGRALLLDEGDAQAAASQRPHHGQTGRAGADDGEIERHVKVL